MLLTSQLSRSVVQRLWDQYKSEILCHVQVDHEKLCRSSLQTKASGRRISAKHLYARKPVVCVPLNGRKTQWTSVLFN
ncbi:hypothetical protein TNCV_3534541 [Trichonephila clavipes]|nr:hypothetical protein TNCV_3534541 [Trichonephila clavipes]